MTLIFRFYDTPVRARRTGIFVLFFNAF